MADRAFVRAHHNWELVVKPAMASVHLAFQDGWTACRSELLTPQDASTCPKGHPRACLVPSEHGSENPKFDFYCSACRSEASAVSKAREETAQLYRSVVPAKHYIEDVERLQREKAEAVDKALMLSNLKARLDEQCEHWSSTHGGRDDRIDCLEEQIRKAEGPDIGEAVAGLAQDIHRLRGGSNG